MKIHKKTKTEANYNKVSNLIVKNEDTNDNSNVKIMKEECKTSRLDPYTLIKNDNNIDSKNNFIYNELKINNESNNITKDNKIFDKIINNNIKLDNIHKNIGVINNTQSINNLSKHNEETKRCIDKSTNNIVKSSLYKKKKSFKEIIKESEENDFFNCNVIKDNNIEKMLVKEITELERKHLNQYKNKLITPEDSCITEFYFKKVAIHEMSSLVLTVLGKVH